MDHCGPVGTKKSDSVSRQQCSSCLSGIVRCLSNSTAQTREMNRSRLEVLNYSFLWNDLKTASLCIGSVKAILQESCYTSPLSDREESATNLRGT